MGTVSVQYYVAIGFGVRIRVGILLVLFTHNAQKTKCAADKDSDFNGKSEQTAAPQFREYVIAVENKSAELL